MKRLRLPFSPLAASWFSLDKNMKTKGRMSSRLRSLDQIHPDTKWEQVPSGAVPAYSLSGAFPSWRIWSRVLLCAAFLLFRHYFWDQGTWNLLIFSTKEQKEQMYACKSQKGVKMASPSSLLHLCGPMSLVLSSLQRPGWWGCAMGSATEEQPRCRCSTAPGRSGAGERPCCCAGRGRDTTSHFLASFTADLRLRRAPLRLRDSTKIGCADSFCSSDSGSVETGLPTVYHAAFN